MGLSGINVAKKIVGALTPDEQVERLRFNRFAGEKIESAIESGSPVEAQTVVLKVNPTNIQFTKRKIIQKVQTNAPSRFVVFDWGHELTVLQIAGVTGNLLPETLSSSGLEPVSDALLQAASWSSDPANTGAAGAVKSINEASRNINAFKDILNGGLTYSEILDMSPKYRRFTDLEKLYNDSDADNDIITVEVGRNIYRGYFEEFDFSISADSPWNWNYSIVFVILVNLTDIIAGGSGYSNTSSYDDS